MSENAKTKRDKVELHISISRDEQEQAFQQTTLRIRTSAVDEKARNFAIWQENKAVAFAPHLSARAGRTGIRQRDFAGPDEELQRAHPIARLLGKVENVSVQRQDPSGGQIEKPMRRPICRSKFTARATLFRPTPVSSRPYAELFAGRGRNHVEFAHDRSGDRVCCAVAHRTGWNNLARTTNP